MIFLLWLLPAILVIVLIGSGRAGVLAAASSGAGAALLVGLCAAPRPFGPAEAAMAVARGGWIGLIVVPYILGGLLFWRMALRRTGTPPPPATAPRDRRSALFSACFLVGPFAESATGFGAGILGASAMMRTLGLRHGAQRSFPLFSQTMVLWGAMGSGLIVGAAYAGTTPTALGLHCFPFAAAVQGAWLPCFWRAAARAGVSATWPELAGEACWIGTGLGAVYAATAVLGPEVAMLAAYGPLVAAHFLLFRRPGRAEAARMLVSMLPFVLLIGGLVLSRLWPPLTGALQAAGRVQPFASAPAWSPLFHAGSWLFAGALLIGLLRRDGAGLRAEGAATWRIGRVAASGVILFSVMAELLAGSGIAAALAHGVFAAAGRWALAATPLLSGTFGLLANTGNAPNGLFMASQVDLARLAGLSVPAVTALQHFSGSMMSIFSPVRMALLCGLAGTPGGERVLYRAFAPAIAGLLMLLTGAALLICLRGV